MRRLAKRDLMEHVTIFGLTVHRLTLAEAVSQCLCWMSEEKHSCRYVVTPNLDHVIQYQERSDLREAYRRSSMVIADGWPLVLASSVSGRPLPERVAGSDLVPALFHAIEQSQEPRSLFLLGAAPGVAEMAAAVITKSSPRVQVVGTYSPPLGFEHSADECAEIRRRINEVSPDLLVVGLGAPKQELWLAAHHEALQVGVAIAAGATIDFLAGRQKRAPVWMQRTHLEWLHRLLSHPRRLAGRYFRDALMLPSLFWREYQNRHRVPNGAILPGELPSDQQWKAAHSAATSELKTLRE